MPSHRKYILWILPSKNPSYGGPPRVAFELVTYFNTAGIESSILILTPFEHLENKFVQDNTSSTFTTLIYSMSFFEYIGSILAPFLRASHIIYSGVWSLNLPILIILSAFFNKRLYVRTSGMLMPYYLRNLRFKHHISLFFLVIPMLRNKHISKITNSDREKRLLSVFSPANVVAIANPSDERLFINLSPEILARRFRTKTILYFARIAPAKGLDLAIRSIYYLHKTISSASLLVVGPISDTCYYRQCLNIIEDLKLTQYVHILKPAYSILDKRRIFNQASCAMFPSHAEGFPNALVECISAGLPALATRNTNLPLSIHMQIGRVIPPDPLGIAKFSAELLTSFPKYEECSKYALKAAKETYSISSIGSSYIDNF